MSGRRQFLQSLFRAAVAAAHPSTCLPPLLPEPPKGRLILLAAGKAAGSMAETAEAFYLDDRKLSASRLSGVAVARHGYGRPTRAVEMIEAGHPIPDAAGLQAAEKALRLAGKRGPGRSRAGADVGRSLRQLDRTGGWRLFRRQAGGDAGRCCAPAPTSARSTRCANISRASKAGGSRRAPIRRG